MTPFATRRSQATVPYPQYLHRPLQLLFFESDEATIFAATLSLVLVFLHPVWLPAVPFPVMLYRRLKQNHPRGFVKHAFWKSGLVRFRHYPSALITHFEE